MFCHLVLSANQREIEKATRRDHTLRNPLYHTNSHHSLLHRKLSTTSQSSLPLSAGKPDTDVFLGEHTHDGTITGQKPESVCQGESPTVSNFTGKGVACSPEFCLSCDVPSCCTIRHSFILQRQDEFEEIHFADYGQQTSANSFLDDITPDDCPQTKDENETSFIDTAQDRMVSCESSSDDRYSQHKKLTRLVPQQMAPAFGRPTESYGGQASYCGAPSVPQFETCVRLDGNMHPGVSLQAQPGTSGHCTNASERFRLAGEGGGGHQEMPYYDYYDYPNNVFNSIFGYSSKTNNWFNEILGCLRPFWSIIGQRESPGAMYDNWEIPFTQLKDLVWLGSGAQGAVFKGKSSICPVYRWLLTVIFFRKIQQRMGGSEKSEREARN